jgi:hypothetical protein
MFAALQLFLKLSVGLRASSQSKQTGRDEFFTSLHHVLPHLVRATFFIEKYASLFPAHRAALFDGESHEIRKCDFGRHSVSILFVCHEIYPIRPSNARFNATRTQCTLSELVLILCFGDAEPTNLVLQRRALQSQPFGSSALSCNPPRSGSQCLNDHTALACRKLEVDPAGKTISAELRSSPSGTSNSSPRVRMTARSMKFASSRTLPFHGQFVSISIACRGMYRISFRIRSDNLETK